MAKNPRSEKMKNNPLGVCKEEVLASLRKVLKDLGYNDVDISLETPPENLGDIAFSCFSLAKVAKKSPQKIAEEIAKNIVLGENIERCENVEAYVNFYINPKKLAEMTLNTVLELKDDYGNSPKIGKRIILEHTSANPTDKLHIGRARNPIIGDTLARILRKAGYDVETQYYVDDMGKQAISLAYGNEIYYAPQPPEILPLSDRENWEKKKDEFLGPYQFGSTVDTIWPVFKQEKDDWLQKLEKGDDEISRKVQSACAKVMDEDITASLARFNVVVDRYVYESQFVQDGSVDKVIAALKESKHFDEEEGAYYIDLEPFTKKEGKFFFQRSDGTSLYATRDIAYHIWKFEQCDDVINILGEDHKLESEQVKVGLDILGVGKAPEVIFYSFVSLPEGRMSTRKGKVVFVENLIEEAVERAINEVKKRREELPEEKVKEIAEKVGIGAIRYNIVRVQAEKKIIFRWEEALNFEGNSAPFIQYSYARASSILRKAKELGYEGYDKYDHTILEHASEVSLIKELAKFVETVKECAERRSPHTMAGYAYGLASMFNQFYRDCPVLACDNSSLKNARLALVESGRIVLKNSLFCLGIQAPEEM
jgi:arginyl-tRNA synthetase